MKNSQKLLRATMLSVASSTLMVGADSFAGTVNGAPPRRFSFNRLKLPTSSTLTVRPTSNWCS